MTWFNDLMGKAAIPTEGSTAGKPVTPVAPFPELPPSQVRDLRFDGRLRRMIATQISPTIAAYLQIAVPSIAVNQFGPEDYYPEEVLGIGTTFPLAAGGQLTQGQLRNPADSGKIIILESVDVSQATLANFLSWAYQSSPTADLATAAASAFRDTRAGTLSSSAVGLGRLSQQVSGAVVGGPGNPWDVQNLPHDLNPFTIPMGITLAPGVAVTWFTTTVGVQQTFVTWRWRERPIVTGS